MLLRKAMLVFIQSWPVGAWVSEHLITEGGKKEGLGLECLRAKGSSGVTFRGQGTVSVGVVKLVLF